jgi:hypothetical protein
MTIRIRLPELLDDKIPTAYALAKATDWAISESTAHRLVKVKGQIGRYDAPIIEALLEVFRLKSFDELFERVKGPTRPKPALPKRR